MLTARRRRKRPAPRANDTKKDQASLLQASDNREPKRGFSRALTPNPHLRLPASSTMRMQRLPAAVKKAIPEIAQVIDQVARMSARRRPADLHRRRLQRTHCGARLLRVPAHLLHGSRPGAVHHGRRTQGAGLGRRSQRGLRRARPARHCPPPPHPQRRCGRPLRLRPHPLCGRRRSLCPRPRSAYRRRHLQP